MISAAHISGVAITVSFMIGEPTTGAGNPRLNGKGTKKKPISATISSPEELPFQKMESRPKMMREGNWMICLRIEDLV